MVFAEISFSLHGSAILAALLILLGLGAAFAFYRFTLPPLPPRRRITLSVLRGCSLALLLVLLFEPIVRIVHRDQQAPHIAVLIDDSQSMGMTDRAGYRAGLVRKWLSARPLNALPAPATPEYFLFSSQLSPAFSAPPDSLAFNGQMTDLAAAFVRLKDRLVRDNLQGVVVVSDGEYTVGRNPLYDARALGIPIFTLGVGDTAEQKDVLVEKVVTNNIAYAESRLPVDVTVKSAGYAGEHVEVAISDGTGILDRASLTMAEGTREYPVMLHVQPHEEGTKKYTVTVSRLPGELTEANNSRSLFVKVLKSKLQVLLFAGAPSPDVAAVRQALEEDGHFTVREYVQKNSSEFYGEKFSRAVVDSADCFVFVGFPTAAAGQSLIAQVKAPLERLKKPLLFIAGRTVDYQRLNQFEPFLPFTVSAVNPAEFQVFPTVNERHRLDPLITLEGNASAETWQQLPPVFKSSAVFHAKPEADVLASVTLQNVVLNEPLVLTRTVNRQRAFAITGYNVWQWRLMAQGNSRTSQFFPSLLSNAVRWLTTKDENRNVRITPLKQIFTTAEPAEFVGQVYDEQLRPVENAEVRVDIAKGSESTQILLQSAGNGVYEGSAEGLSDGDYSFTGRASVNGKPVGVDAGKFSVGNVNVEFLETRMNKPLLEQLAFRSGGTYNDIVRSENLVDDLSRNIHLAPKEIVQASEIELWNWQYLLGALVVLLGLEWFIRKLNGML